MTKSELMETEPLSLLALATSPAAAAAESLRVDAAGLDPWIVRLRRTLFLPLQEFKNEVVFTKIPFVTRWQYYPARFAVGGESCR